MLIFLICSSYIVYINHTTVCHKYVETSCVHKISVIFTAPRTDHKYTMKSTLRVLLVKSGGKGGGGVCKPV